MSRPRRPASAPPDTRLSPPVIYGIGTDILRLERIERVWARHGERLPQKILGDEELKEFAERRKARHKPARYLAMAFAAKEAFVKALGTGFHGVDYADAGVIHEESGRPVMVFSARMKERLARLGIVAAHVSLSDEGGLVCAFVVLERAARPA